MIIRMFERKNRYLYAVFVNKFCNYVIPVQYFPFHYLWCRKFLGDSRYSHGTSQSLAYSLLRPRKGLFRVSCWSSGT